MATERELREKLWKALKSDRTMMLGLSGQDGGQEDGHARPMTAQIEDEGGPIWFFTSSDNGLVEGLSHGNHAVGTFADKPNAVGTFADKPNAVGTFADKGHDLFATLHGTLALHQDRATIDRLWNPFIAAWYEGGKDDPTLRLLRFDASEARIWLNENNLFAGLKLLLGINPQKDYADKVATVSLH